MQLHPMRMLVHAPAAVCGNAHALAATPPLTQQLTPPLTRSIHKYPGAEAKDSQADITNIMARMAKSGYSAVFLTDRVMPDHYLKLPSVWPQVLTAACATDAYSF